jgi:hypothetical protein
VHDGGPDALQQVSQLLAGRAGLDELVVAPGAEMPEPTPVALQGVGDVAVPVRDPAGDDGGVLEIRAVPGEVLLLAAAVHQHRVHAHHLHTPRPAPLQHRLPAVPGRLAADDHTCEPGVDRDRQRPVDDVVDHPRVTVEHAPTQRDRVVIGDHRRLLGRSQVDPHHRQIRPDNRTKTGQLLVAAAITTRERPTVGHSILLGSGWSFNPNLARGMLRVVDPDSTTTGTY